MYMRQSGPRREQRREGDQTPGKFCTARTLPYRQADLLADALCAGALPAPLSSTRGSRLANGADRQYLGLLCAA